MACFIDQISDIRDCNKRITSINFLGTIKLMNETLSPNRLSADLMQPLTANESSPGIVNSTALAGSRSYYRSRTFTSFNGCNPLMAAANALLAFNEQLKVLTEFSSLEQLHQDLVHEVRAFESNAQDRGFNAETILVARYVLCAAIDETIIFGQMKNRNHWQHHKLISTFQNEQSADERLFLIIQRLTSNPALHIDLLELIYTCLSLGLEGKYRHEPKGHLHLRELIDNLFHLIRAVRNDPPALLESKPRTQTKAPITLETSLWPILLKATAVVLISIGLIYGSFAFVFDKVSTPVKQQISTLLNTKLS